MIMYPMGKIVYLYHFKDTYAVILPIINKKVEFSMFLPKGTYTLSLCTDKNLTNNYNDIQGSYFIQNTMFILQSDFVVERRKITKIVSSNVSDTNTGHVLTKTNFPFPWTHNIPGMIYLSTLETFLLSKSSNVNIKILFSQIPKNCYLKLETYIDAI